MAAAAAAITTISTLLLLLLLLPHIIIASSPHQLTTTQNSKISTVDLAALYSIKSSLTDLPRSSFFSSWDFSSPDPCSTFSGVTCFLNRVTILSLGTTTNLPATSLSGTLPPSLSNLTQLTQLSLSPGLVTGPIPPQLASLTNLRVISLSNNRLTGTIPSAFSTFPNLHTLDLSFNQLTGSIPPALFTDLTQLKVLVLSSNQLSGTLPPTVSTDVLHLDLKSNLLTGELPLHWPSTLHYLSVSNNMMLGPLNGLQSLSELVYLDLSMNHFSGPIPPSLLFNTQTTLSSLFLQRNNLSGGLPFPPSRGPTPPVSYGEGSIVDLSHNSLSGELSPVLVDVETLFLNNNRLMGVVPEEYVDSVYRGRTKTLYLQHNYLSGFPLELGLALPDTVALCLSYNCMVPPPVGLRECPSSAGEQLSRPESQCGATIH